MSRIASCLMVKNEHKRLPVTLKSMEGFVTHLIALDTGSEDDTVKIMEDWCVENKVEFHLKNSSFIDFSASRNELLDFADTIEGVDFYLLMDCNDEIRGGEVLLKECEKFSTATEQVFMVRQKWLTGKGINEYLNSRLIKPKCGWRYKKRVHEYLDYPDKTQPIPERPKLSEEFYLYQDRNCDDDKSKRRFIRDKEWLLEDVKKYNDSRDVFYLAQTCACLDQYNEAVEWYLKRGDMVEGFAEERFHSYLRTAEIMIKYKNDVESAIYYSFLALMIDFRAEPLVLLSTIYKNKNDNILAYYFIHCACELEYPQRILFINGVDYAKTRWNLLCVMAYSVGKYKEGLYALERSSLKVDDIESYNVNSECYNKVKDKPDTDKFPVEDLPQEIIDIYDTFIENGKKYLGLGDQQNAILSYLKAFELTRYIKPLLIISELIRVKGLTLFPYKLVQLVHCMETPSTFSKNCLQVDYTYSKYHLLGNLAWQVGKMGEGKEACLKALKEGKNIALDKSIYENYCKPEPKVVAKNFMSLEEYKLKRLPELRAQNPNQPDTSFIKRMNVEYNLKKSLAEKKK